MVTQHTITVKFPENVKEVELIRGTIPSCWNVNCEPESKNKELQIEVEIDEDLCTGDIDNCFDIAYIYSECSNCPPQVKTICLCGRPNTVLTKCQKCINGVIVDSCSEDELSQGKECKDNGDCGCPTNKPFFNEDLDRCVECEEGSIHPTNKCLICKNGEYTLKECDGECLPSTGECIDDCSKKPNSKYNPTTGKCECIGGFIEDENGNCVKAPECDPNDDLPDCIACIGGKLVQLTEGDCAEANCNGNCVNGLDCPGEGCGCSKTEKECVKCEDDPTALGCNDPCGKESCDDENPCTGKDCTCVEGECVGCNNFPCSTCGNVEGCGCTDGANCVGDDNPNCQDKITLVQEDCALKTTLSLKSKCPCIAIGTSLQVKEITSTKLSNGDTEYYAVFNLDLRKKWNANTLGYENEERFIKSTELVNNDFPTTASYNLNLTAVYIDNLGETFENTIPAVSGQIKTGTGASQTTFVSTPAIKLGKTDSDFGQSGTSRLLGYKIASKVGDVIFTEKNCTYGQKTIYTSSDIESIDTTSTVSYLTIDKLTSSSNKNPRLTITRSNSINPTGEIVRSLYKLPTSSGQYEDTLFGPKKLSLLEKGKQILSEALKEGELLPLNTYEAKWDCGCDDPETLTLQKCDDEMSKWARDVHFTIETRKSVGDVDGNFELGERIDNNACNNTVIGKDSFAVCAFNEILSNNYPTSFINAFQTKYIVKATLVNGDESIIATLVHDGIKFVLDNKRTQTWEGLVSKLPYRVVSVSIEQNHDSVLCKFEETIPFDLDANVRMVCSGSNPLLRVSEISGQIQSIIINGNTNSPNLWVENTTIQEYGITQGINNVIDNAVLVTFVGGCSKLYTVSADCCASDEAVVEVSSGFDSKTFIFDFSTLLGAGIASITLNETNYTFSNVTNVEGLSYSFPDFRDFTYSGVITTASNCQLPFSGTATVREDDNEFTVNPSVICENGTVTYSLSTDSPNTSFTLNTPTGIVNEITDVNGNFSQTINNVSSQNEGSYTLQTFGGSNVGIVKTLQVNDLPIIQGLGLSGNIQSSYCENTPIQIQVQGTSGSIVLLNLGDGRQQSVTIPQGSTIGTTTITYPDFDNYTISTVSSSNGSCSTPNTNLTLNVSITDGIDMDINTFCTGVTSEGNVNVSILANNATEVRLYSNVTGALLATLSDSGGFNFNTILPSASGLELRAEASSTSSSCTNTEIFVAPQCDCPPMSPPVVENVPYACNNGTVSITLANQTGSIIEWYYASNPDLTSPDFQPGQTQNLVAGFYKVRYRNTTTGCSSDLTNFRVADGTIFSLDIVLSPNSSPNPSVGESIVLIANTQVASPPGSSDINYTWFVSTDGGTTYSPVTSGVSGNTLNYQITSVDTFTFRVDARRGISTCTATDTYEITSQTSCDPNTLPEITSTANMAGPCGNPTIGTNGQEDSINGIEWKVGTTVISTGLSMDISDDTIFLPGVPTDYTITLYKAGCNPQIFNYTYTKNQCVNSDIVYFVDNSASISGTEVTSIHNHIINSSTQLNSANSNIKFSAVHYYSSSVTVEHNSINTPIPSLTDQTPGLASDFLQPSISDFITNVIPTLNITTANKKLIIYTDATGYSSSLIANQSAVVNNGVWGAPAGGFTFTDSDNLKAMGWEIIVVRYPHGTQPSTNFQQLSDQLLTSVASPGKFFPTEFSNDITNQLLNSLNCNC